MLAKLRGYFTNRRKFNSLLAYVLVVGLVLTVAYFISAQQRPRQFQRRQINPEALIQRMMERTMRELNLSEEETAVLKPKIEGILKTRMEQNREMQALIDDLQKAIEAKDDAQIKEKLELVKAKRKEQKAKAETLEKELVELLTLKQEAQLTILGVVNSDGTGSFFGGFRGQQRPPRRGQR